MKELQFKNHTGSVDITLLTDIINDTDDSLTIYQVSNLTDANIQAGYDFKIEPTTFTAMKALSKEKNVSMFVHENGKEKITLRNELYILDVTIADGVVNVAHIGAEIEATGGVGDLTWEESEDSNLPAGMTFDTASQELAGTPTETGDFELIVVVTDTEGTSVTKSFEFTIAAE